MATPQVPLTAAISSRSRSLASPQPQPTTTPTPLQLVQDGRSYSPASNTERQPLRLQPAQPAQPQPASDAASATATAAQDKNTVTVFADVTRISSSASIARSINSAEPSDVSPSSSTATSLSCATSGSYSYFQTPIESLRRYPTDVAHPIPEEGDEETGSESYNEPVTPVSGRQSRDFRYCEQNDTYQTRDFITNGLVANPDVPDQSDASLIVVNKDVVSPALFLSPPTQILRPAPDNNPSPLSSPTHGSPPSPTFVSAPKPQPQRAPLKSTTSAQPEDPRPVSARRPSTPRRLIARRSSSALSRAMSMFKRNSYHQGENSSSSTEFREPSYNGGAPHASFTSVNKVTPNPIRRRFSVQRSSATTRSNTPPSPASPSETTSSTKDKTSRITIPTARDFLENNSKKSRANTGINLRGRVGFASTKNAPRRTRSVERKLKNDNELTRQPWEIPPDVGTGMKARRLSLSLPDDFTVDVAELLKEYEYQHKLFGRHGKHLGKGATSKVTLMVRKGSPGELYAVKEFRSKSSSESVDEYEKKIKSEYSISKSLHHPNIVETIRLCTNHGRWNHVMEYCSEGDLFSLVSKKYLKEEGRSVDRLCLFKQLCQGINYLHSNGIAHRDIKLENLLITKDSKLKITDFGVSEVFSGIHPGLREAGGQCGIGMGEIRLCKPGICGSLPYIAPEVLSKKADYDPRALDVWSSAVVMIYLTFNANLWEKADASLSSPGQKTYNDLVSGWEKVNAKTEANPGELKDAYPKVLAFEYFMNPVPLRRLVLKMLNPDPKKRISMNEVITNRWMKNVECCQLESYEDPVKFIDASKKDCMKSSTGKIFCHNHLPPVSTGHGLPPMPGKPGY
ncbi:kinase-like protein [Hypoxylon sp. FL1284]|nr:kinase-like protein [Hypoxylon sp. FL1284]